LGIAEPTVSCAQAALVAPALCRPSAACIRKIVAQAFAVPIGQLRTPLRGCRRVAVARQCAMYLVHILAGLSFTEIGRAFGRDRTTAAYACRRFEELRDDPTIDAFVETLETRCAARMRAEAAS
jgi:chromosomal replication initiation ATPase DnaA